ncbi:MAG: sulfite exporter TauE/SafE family protein [Firmicutes bacterium]|nr:sulfite exporter TauE/SafE family protein [Clostridiales bacterium]MBQ4340053.1 sulfite exporter TauE/SafE family protein [Bacillota bacterium]
MTAALITAGFVSGIIAGMGVGGGSILVPILAVFTTLSQQEIQGINLVVFIPASIAALCVHKKTGNIDFSLAKPIIIYGIIGAAAGAFAAIALDASVLRKIFAVFIFIIGVFQLTKKDRS